MATHKIKDLAVVQETYMAQGKQNKKWLTIGGLFQKDDGGQFLMLDRHINIAALPCEPGRSSIIVSMFDVKDKATGATAAQQRAPAPSPAPRQASPAQNQMDDFDDDVPFNQAAA